MKIIYPVPETLPDPRARFIQIVNTCVAFAQMGIKVQLLAGIKKGYSTEKILEFYGMSPHPNLVVVNLPLLRREHARHLRFSWNGVFYFFLLLHLLFEKFRGEPKRLLFLRYLKLAHFILRFRNVLNTPILFEIHEIFHLTTDNARKKEKLRDIESSVYSCADVVVSISQSIKDVLAHMGIRRDSIYVVPNGINSKWFGMGRASSGSNICYTGSLYPWKGVDILISAMRYLPDEQLVIVGGGERLEELKRFSMGEGVSARVSFVGAVPYSSIPDYLARAKIAILPNIECGPSVFSSPLKLFEYMASGLPIVASDLPVFREILSHGKNSILVEPGNPRALASGINFLLQNPGVANDIAAQANADIENFTYERRAGRILNLIMRECPEKG